MLSTVFPSPCPYSRGNTFVITKTQSLVSFILILHVRQLSQRRLLLSSSCSDRIHTFSRVPSPCPLFGLLTFTFELLLVGPSDGFFRVGLTSSRADLIAMARSSMVWASFIHTSRPIVYQLTISAFNSSRRPFKNDSSNTSFVVSSTKVE